MRKHPSTYRFARSRGAVSRFASALLFVCAAVAVVVFPEGEAGGLSAKFGFRPAQVPVGALADNSAEYDNPLLCADLGGKIENGVSDENVCSEIDVNDTFCIVGSSDAFPCRGLFKHVILCNDQYERPALNPFFCGARCDAATEKARGARCERFFSADEILPESARNITVAGLTEGDTGTIATLQAASALTGQDRTDYGSFEIVNHRPVSDPASNGLTIVADGENRLLQIAAGYRLGRAESTRTVVAKSFCSIKDADNREKCYPTFLTIAVDFTGVVSRVDVPLASVVAADDRNVSINVAVGYTGAGHKISLVDATAYDLTAHQYNRNAHGYDEANDIILIDTPIAAAPSGSLEPSLKAVVVADVVCLTPGALCRDARLTITADFHAINAQSQNPIVAEYEVFNGDSFVFPAEYVVSGVPVAGITLSIVGVDGYAGDLTRLNIQIRNDGVLNVFDRPGLESLDVGQYNVTVAMTHETMLGTLFSEVPLEIRPRTPRLRYELPGGLNPEVVIVVGDYAGKVYEVQYPSKTPPAVLLLPDSQPEGLSLALSESGLALTVYPALPVRAGAMLESVANVTVTVINPNYDTLAQPLAVRVSALAKPDVIARFGNSPHPVTPLFNFGIGLYENAVFGKESGSEQLTVDANGNVSVLAVISNAGLHNIVVTATSAGFLGVARLELELNVQDPNDVSSGRSIPTPKRKLFRAIGSEYDSTVAFFAAEFSGVTLALGDDNLLSGFAFVKRDGASAANSDIVSPDGFYVSIAGANLAAGDATVAAFEITAKYAEKADTAISLEVTVSVVSPPTQIELRTNATADFEPHSLILPEGFEYGAVLNVEGADAGKFRIVDGKLAPVAGVARDSGSYNVEVIMTHPDIYGEVVLLVPVMAAKVIEPDDFLANRDVTVTVANGYSGPGYTFPVDGARYTVVAADYDSAAAGYDAETHAVEILSGNPVRGGDNLTVEIVATVDCVLSGPGDAACARRAISLTVTFVPLVALEQDELNEDYDEGFEHRLRIRSEFRTGATLAVAAVLGGDDNLFTLNADGEIIRGAAVTPPAGAYVIRVEMTHVEWRGVLSLSVTANISPADLKAEEYGLTAENAYVVAGYAGGLHQNIVLPSSAVEAVLELPSESPDGLALALAENQRAAAVELVSAINGEIVRTVTLTVTRNDPNYNDLEQLVVLTVTALGVPPLVSEQGAAATGRPFNRVFRNLSAGGYEGGNYAGGIFADVFADAEGESPDLQVSPNGEISTKRGLEAGDYGVTIMASGRPTAADANFAGTATITVQLSVTLGVVDLTEDEVVLPAARNVVLDAVDRYFGRGYEIPVEIGHTLSAANYDANLLGYEEDGYVISVLDTNPVLAQGLTLSLIASGDCAGAAADQCVNVSVGIVAEFRAIAAPAQDSASAKYLDGFTVALTPPAGYESGAKLGRVLEIVGVDGLSGDFANVSLAVNADNLEYTPGDAESNALTVGQYTIRLEMSQTEAGSPLNSLLGTVTLEVDAEVTPRGLDAAGEFEFVFVDPARATVTVAAGAGAIGEELARVSLSASAEGAIVVLPDAFPDNLSVGLDGENSVAVFYLAAAVASGNEFSRTASLTVTLNSNHGGLERLVALTISALQQQRRAEPGGQIPLNGAYEETNIHDFGAISDYANATFLKTNDPENSDKLTVSMDGIVSTESSITVAGMYTIAVNAESSDYVGAARLELVLDLVEEGELSSADTILPGDRERLVLVAPSINPGEKLGGLVVASFAAANADVTLRTPANPANFNFGTDGANKDYTSSEEFSLHLNGGVVGDPGETAVANFTVTASADRFADDYINLIVTVSVLPFVPRVELTVTVGENINYQLPLEDYLPGGLAGDNGNLSLAYAMLGTKDVINLLEIDGRNLRLSQAGINAGGLVDFGYYNLSIEWKEHPKFKGIFHVEGGIAVKEPIVPDNVVAAEERNVTVTVAAGHVGLGHAIPLSVGYVFQTVLHDDDNTDYNAGEDAVYITAAVANDLQLAVTATVDCLPSVDTSGPFSNGPRVCDPRALTVSVMFVPLQPIAQRRLDVDDNEDFHREVETGDYDMADVTVSGVGGGADNLFIVEETPANSGDWTIARNPVGLLSSGKLPFGTYTIFLEMTDDGFIGELPLAVTASIQETIDPSNVVVERNPMVDAAAGYVGSAYTISVESGYTLAAEVYDSNLLGYDAENKVISIVESNRVPSLDQLALTVRGEGRCVTRDCKPVDIEVVAVFPVIDAAQDTATAPFTTGWTVSLKFPAGYENGAKTGRKMTILHPLPQTGDIAANEAMCEALGGTEIGSSSDVVCTGYAATPSRTGTTLDDIGICLIRTANPLLWMGSYRCADAFTKARDCNMDNTVLKNNGACGAEKCEEGKFALGGKCLALKLNEDGDMLEYAPTGAADAINAGMRQIVVGMTETNLLGTVRLDVAADISQIQLSARRFRLSAPERATITIAAGAGAVGEELARVGLTVVDAAIEAVIVDPDPNNIRGNLSLNVIEGQTVVFYFNSALSGNGRATAEIVELTVNSPNLNYTQFLQSVTLNIQALTNPEVASASGVAGSANPYSETRVHDFKTGNSGDYANAEFKWAGGSEELTLGADGVVSVTGNITLGGTYTLEAFATSPDDFIGRALLKLELELAEEGVFTSDRTIPSNQRKKDVVVVPGYSGSVAFFAAATMGVTLQTPADPADFSFGTDGANRDYVSPDGFTLFLDANQVDNEGETAVAEFVVTAKAAGFTTDKISLAVTVTALTPSSQETLVARDTDADYGSVKPYANFSLDTSEIVGVEFYDAAADNFAPLDNWAASVRIDGANLRPFNDVGVASERLDPGMYRITVKATHSGVLGDLLLTVPVNIQETLNENDVVAAAARNATVTVATGYSGRGYRVPLESGHVFDTVSFDAGTYDADNTVILIPNAVEADLQLVITATASCSDLSRNCAPLALTVSVLFVPTPAIAQNLLTALENTDFPDHPVQVGVFTGATLSISGIAGPSDNVFKLNDSKTAIIRDSDPGSDLQRGLYTITVNMTHTGFLGTLELKVPARIQEELLPNEVLTESQRDVTIRVAPGYSGNVYQIPLKFAEHELVTILFDPARADYSENNNFIQIPRSGAVTEGLTLAVTLTVDCADGGRDCAPLALTVSATFIPLSLFSQTELNEVYDANFTHTVNTGEDYTVNNGANLTIVGVDGGNDDIFELTGDEIGPGVGNAPPAGAYTITVDMTHDRNGAEGGFWGTLTLEVTANISRKPLADAGFGLSFPGTVTVAAGAGAVDKEIARAELTGGSAEISASIQEQTVFPDNLSLAFLPPSESQTVAFYLTMALSGDGADVARMTELTIISADPNYSPSAQIVALTITALRNPQAAVVNGTVLASTPYNNNSVFDFKEHGGNEEYKTATNFARDDDSSNAELQLAANGIVSTDGDIADAGTYTVVAFATSPDFAGEARLEMQLVLVSAGAFSPSDTIERRVQNVNVVPNYSGSVAFFAAGKEGVTLRTPSAAPAGFSLGGADALNQDFRGRDNGFTLFLSAGQAEGAMVTAVFTVTANQAGFSEEVIGLTVTVAAVTLPAAVTDPATVTVGHEVSPYAVIPLISGYPLDANNSNPFEVVGVGVYEDDGLGGRVFTRSLDKNDYDSRVEIMGSDLSPILATDENQRLDPGLYQITVAMTHTGFRGTLTLEIPVDIEETLNLASVVLVPTATQTVAVGHFGDSGDAGYQIPIEDGYALSDFSFDDSLVTVDEASNEIKAASPVDADLTAAVTAAVTCTDSDRNCAALQITLSVIFVPLASPAQNDLTATPKPDKDSKYNLSLVAPSGYNFADGAVSVVGVATLNGEAHPNGEDLVQIDENHLLQHDGAGLPAGEYAVMVDMTHSGFLGTLTLTVTARIETVVKVDEVLKNENRRVTQNVAFGYSGAGGRTITIDATEYELRNFEYNRSMFTVAVDTDATDKEYTYEVGLLAGSVTVTANLVAAVTANVECVGDKVNQNCRAQEITLEVTFSPVAALMQGTLNVGHQDAMAYNHDISLAAEHRGAGLTLMIAGAINTDNGEAVTDIASRIRIESNQLQRVGDTADQRLALGKYEITVEATTSDHIIGFLGTLTLTIAANIQETVNPDNVLADRDLTLFVAVGHPAGPLGDSSYIIPVSTDYQLQDSIYDGNRFEFAVGTYEVRLADAMPDNDLEMTVVADVICTTVNNNCAPLLLTFSVTFKPVAAPVQTLLEAKDTASTYNHTVALPANFVDATLTVEIVNADLSSRLTILTTLKTEDGRSTLRHILQPVNGSEPDSRLLPGISQEIALRVTHPDFVGMLTLIVTANIQGDLTADGAVKNRGPTVYVADGWFSEPDDAGYVIVLEPGHRLNNVVVETDGAKFVKAAGYNDYSAEIALSTGFAYSDSDPAANIKDVIVRADVGCDPDRDPDGECSALPITMTIAFEVLENPKQAVLEISEGDSFNHQIVIPGKLDRNGASYEILEVTKGSVTVQSETKTPNARDHIVVIDNGFLQPRVGFTAEDAEGTRYEVLLRVSHSNLVGDFREVPVTVDVSKPVDADAVLGRTERNIILNVVEGHFDDASDAGHTIPFTVAANVELAISYDGSGSPAFEVNENSYEVSLVSAMTGDVSVRALTLTATVSCKAEGSRICGDPEKITLTVTFNRIGNVVFPGVTDEFNSIVGFTVGVGIPSEYEYSSGDTSRVVSVVGALDYPLPLDGDVPVDQSSCEALGGRHLLDGAVEVCVDYTFSNSEERAAAGGGCVLSQPAPAGEIECQTAFNAVRDCNKDSKPALNNRSCSNNTCPGGFAIGGECPIVSALTFEDERDVLVYAPGFEELAPGAGGYTVTVELTHPRLLGTLIAGAVVSVTKKDSGLALRKVTDTRRVVAGHTGEIYRTTATEGGTIALATELPVGYSATGGKELVIILDQPLVAGSDPTEMFTVTLNYNNLNRARNYNGKRQVLALLLSVLGKPSPQIRPVRSNGYTSDNVYDFSTDYEGGIYAGATFTEVGDSPHFQVNTGGTVRTQTQAGLAPGEYAITLTAEDLRDISEETFIGTITLTLSLTVLADDGADEFVNNPNSIVRVAVGHTGGVYTLTAKHTYTLANYAVAGSADLEFDQPSGVFSIPDNNAMGNSARRMTVGVDAICPHTGMNMNGVADFCTPGEAAARLTVTLIAVPVDAENVEATPAYGSNFNRPVLLPWISTENDFSGAPLVRFNHASVIITLVGADPIESANQFTLINGRVQFTPDDLPDIGGYTLSFNISYPNGDGIAGFVGTVATEMSINVGVAAGGIQGVPDADLLQTNLDAILVEVPFGDLNTPLHQLTLADNANTDGISVEFAEPPTLPEGSPYSISRSDDRQTLILGRSTAETADALPTAGSGVASRIVDALFTVIAAGDDASRYEPKVQRFAVNAAEFAEPIFESSYEVTNSFSGVTLDLATIRIVSGERAFRDRSTYGDYATLGLAFTLEAKEGEGISVSVSASGTVVVEEISETGSYSAVIAATASGFRGVARFTLSVQVNDSGSDLIFASTNLSLAGTIVLKNIAEDSNAPGEKVTLSQVSMVYHGVRRGLHWVYGSKYNGFLDGLSGDNDWHAKSICEGRGNEGSSGWRLPTLLEMAGGVLPNDETTFAVEVAGADVGQALGIFEIGGDDITPFVTLTVQAVGANDAIALSSSSKDDGFFAGVFDTNKATKGSAANVYYDENVRVSRGGIGKVACVKPVSSTYNKKLWAELSVDDGNAERFAVEIPIISLTATATDQKVTANVTMGLGLFTLRGAAEPQPVANPNVSDFSLDRLDNHSAFTINLVSVSGGIVLEASVPSDGGIPDPDDGEYVLSLIFAPAGKYIGFSQVVYAKNSFGETDETQFNVVRLTVDWTKPPTQTAVSSSITVVFAGTTIEYFEDVAVVTVTNRTFTGTDNMNMKYYGDVGGLRVMYSTNTPDGGSAYGPHLCEAGGVNWRNPTLTELGMLLTGPTVTGLSLTVRNSEFGQQTGGDAAGLNDGIPGQTGTAAEVLALIFPTVTDIRGGMTMALSSDYTFAPGKFQVGSGLHENAGEPLGLIFDAKTPGQAGMDVYVKSVWVCVQEIAGYPDPSSHSQLAGVRFEASGDNHGVPTGGTIALSVSAITVSGVSFTSNAAAFTITAKAFIFDDVDPPGVYNVVIKDLTNETLSVGFGDKANDSDSGVFNLNPTVDATVGEVKIVVNFGSTTPTTNAQKELEIEVKPPLGAPVTFTLEFPDLF